MGHMWNDSSWICCGWMWRVKTKKNKKTNKNNYSFIAPSIFVCLSQRRVTEGSSSSRESQTSFSLATLAGSDWGIPRRFPGLEKTPPGGAPRMLITRCPGLNHLHPSRADLSFFYLYWVQSDVLSVKKTDSFYQMELIRGQLCSCLQKGTPWNW